MKLYILRAIVFAFVVVGLVIYLSPSPDEAITFYGDKIRASLFTGLLTVGSFLLSLKVFIIVKFKENVFDSKEYIQRFEERKKLDRTLRRYSPVRNLSNVLFLSIVSALTASASQITVGLIHHVGPFAVCVILAAFAGAMLVQTLWLIRSIISEWLNHGENGQK